MDTTYGDFPIEEIAGYHFEENTDGKIKNAATRVLRDCKIFGNCGKNLLPYPFRYHNIYGVKNGITVTDSGDSSITLNGTAMDYTVVYIETSGNYPLAAGKYFLSGKPSNITGFRLTAGATGNDGSTLLYVTDDGAGAAFDISEIANNDNYQGITIAIRINEGTVFDNLILKPQLELGEAATAFEPYKEVGDSDAESGKYVLPVTASGKNLISYPYSMATKTANGITFTDNGDGTVTANGTATAAASFVCKYYNAKTPIVPDKKVYYLSGCPDGGRTSASVWNYRINAMTYKEDSYVGGYSDFGDGKTVDLRNVDFDTLQVQIIINNGASVDNLVFKPQLELGETATDFEPYTTPKTTNLLLDAPLGPGESISCREKGLLVPELATTDPRITNYITFGSKIKPSGAKFEYYKY